MPIAANGDVYDYEEIYPLAFQDDERDEDLEFEEDDFSQLDELILRWENLNSRF